MKFSRKTALSMGPLQYSGYSRGRFWSCLDDDYVEPCRCGATLGGREKALDV